MYIGYISTLDQIIYGKNKSKKLYKIKCFNIEISDMLISYNGKLHGKIIIVYKIKNTNDNKTISQQEIIKPMLYIDKTTFKKLLNSDVNIQNETIFQQEIIKPTLYVGEIINIIGYMNNDNLLITLQYIYNIYRSNKSLISQTTNLATSTIIRPLINKFIFSIDPKGCNDIDDALSYEIFETYYLVSIYIAQPITFLTEEVLINRSKVAFSTLYNTYNNNKNDNLWRDDITFKSSFIQNLERDAYCIEFFINKNFTINNIKHYPAKIINKFQTNYDECLNNEIINNFYNFTIQMNIYNKIENLNKFSTHNLVSYWMILTNNYIGNLNNINKLNIPYRIVKEKYSMDNIFDNIQDIAIKNIFISKIQNSAIYSLDDTNRYHSKLQISNYIHFTSPIRRIIDTIIHWCITYNINFKDLINKYNSDLDIINKLDKATKNIIII